MPISIPTVTALHQARLYTQLQNSINQKTKPLGSLGQLEALGLQLGLVQQTLTPQLIEPQLLVFAGDHGLAQEGVSAYPSDVTWQMVENFLTGGAAVNVLARQHGLALTVIDAGVDHVFEPRKNLVHQKIAMGTANSFKQCAMTAAQCALAVQAGFEVVRALPGNVVLLGEMGIGNTASAALLMALLTGVDVVLCTGRGTGLDDAAFAHKQAVLAQVLARHQTAVDPWDAMAAVGGFELAMLAGAALQAASQRRVVVVDGFIASAAMLWAARLSPGVLDYCVWSHTSAEAGHVGLLQALGAAKRDMWRLCAPTSLPTAGEGSSITPLLNLGLRLGEGSGAALAWPLIESAARLLCDMASFESAKVSGHSN
jgi:nicotinate-nucleotide--dimethylbenzimidazole phosphoribosyltransferase